MQPINERLRDFNHNVALAERLHLSALLSQCRLERRANAAASDTSRGWTRCTARCCEVSTASDCVISSLPTLKRSLLPLQCTDIHWMAALGPCNAWLTQCVHRCFCLAAVHSNKDDFIRFSNSKIIYTPGLHDKLSAPLLSRSAPVCCVVCFTSLALYNKYEKMITQTFKKDRNTTIIFCKFAGPLVP